MLEDRRRGFILLLLVLFVGVLILVVNVLIPSENERWERPVTASGTYAWKTDNGGCVLQIVHKRTPEPFDWADFRLRCSRGAPSYNMGEMAGRMIVDRDLGVYTFGDEADLSEGPCHLVFHFSRDTIEVRQLGRSFDCGFGSGVYATGVYRRSD